jgi:hypothetical protein
MPSSAALAATSGSFMSSTSVSQDGHAIRLTVWIASSHAGQPALKISILRLLLLSSLRSFVLLYKAKTF